MSSSLFCEFKDVVEIRHYRKQQFGTLRLLVTTVIDFFFFKSGQPLFTVIHGRAFINRLRLLGLMILWHDSSESS